MTHTGEADEFSDFNLQGGGTLVDGGADVMLNATITRGCITIDISYDQTSEPAENLTLSFESRNSGSNITLNPSETVVTILDNNGKYDGCLSTCYNNGNGLSNHRNIDWFMQLRFCIQCSHQKCV